MPMLGILFDVDELGDGLYGYAAYQIFFDALDTRQLAGCDLYDGDTYLTRRPSACLYCIAIDSADAAQIDLVRNALGASHSKGLLPLPIRFLDHDQVSRAPLVQAGWISSAGELVGDKTGWITSSWKKSQEKHERSSSTASAPVVQSAVGAVTQSPDREKREGGLMMSFLHNLFGKKQPADRQEREAISGSSTTPTSVLAPAPPSATSVTIDGTSFPLVNSVAALCSAIEAGGKGALRFPSMMYREILLDLTQRLEKRYGRSSRQYLDTIPSPLLCAGCLWEFPGSYKLSLQGAFRGTGMVFGAATPGFDQFETSGICPQCGNHESLLVYEYFPSEQISMSDVDAIRRYWQQQARIWWQSQQPLEASCDYCYTAIARNQGYLSGSSLICEGCVTRGLMTEGLEKLKGDPHYYGPALLRKVRRFRT